MKVLEFLIVLYIHSFFRALEISEEEGNIFEFFLVDDRQLRNLGTQSDCAMLKAVRY